MTTTISTTSLPIIALLLLSIGVACDALPPEIDGGVEARQKFFAEVLGEVPTADLVEQSYRDPTPSLTVDQVWLDVGPLVVRGGRSTPFLVNIPIGMRSVTLLTVGAEDALVLVDEAISPGGTRFVSPANAVSDAQANYSGARGFPSHFFSLTRQIARREHNVTRFPLRDDVELEAGSWFFRIRSASSEVAVGPGARPPVLDRPVHVALVGEMATSTNDDDDDNQTLTLALHFSGAGGLDAEEAVDDEDLRIALAEVARIFSIANARVVVGSYHDIDDAALSVVELDASRGCAGQDFDALLESSKAPPGELALFFIERFSCVNAAGIDVGTFLGGLTGGIPTPVFASGSSRAGIAVATAAGVDDAAFAELIAHEIGHALGLFHVLENTSSTSLKVADIISDTSEDEGESQSNLMFHRLNGRTRISDGQAIVLRRHPGVRP